MTQDAVTLVTQMIEDTELALQLAGRNYAASLETVQTLSNQLADAADYGYARRVSDLTDAAQKVAQYHQEAKTLTDSLDALRRTLAAAQPVKETV